MSTSPFKPGDRVYFVGWVATGDGDDDEDEPAEWATVVDQPSSSDRTSVEYDERPGAVFGAITVLLTPASEAPVPDPRQEATS